MFELVYYSSARPGLTPEDVSDILKTARNFNSKKNITGCLLYYNEEFLQVLEGEKEAVMDLLAKIKQDKRHSNVTILAEDDKNERMFSSWNMAYHEFDGKRPEEQLLKNKISSFAKAIDHPSNAIDLFWTMAQNIAVD